MLRFVSYQFLFLFTSAAMFAQKAPQKAPAKSSSVLGAKSVTKPTSSHSKYRNLGIGIGLTRSVLYLSRNVKEDNNATGLNFAMVYGISRLLRLSMEYTHYLPVNIEPTWYDIKANTFEVNTHVIARLKNSNAYFYPLFGLSYNIFSGTYTGINDFLNLNSIYTKNDKVVTQWIGLNVGTGYEYFFKPGSFFMDYKMRVGLTEGYNQINIQDVCISAGLRLNLKVRSLRSIFIYRDTRSRYLLDKADED